MWVQRIWKNSADRHNIPEILAYPFCQYKTTARKFPSFAKIHIFSFELSCFSCFNISNSSSAFAVFKTIYTYTTCCGLRHDAGEESTYHGCGWKFRHMARDFFPLNRKSPFQDSYPPSCLISDWLSPPNCKQNLSTWPRAKSIYYNILSTCRRQFVRKGRHGTRENTEISVKTE